MFLEGGLEVAHDRDDDSWPGKVSRATYSVVVERHSGSVRWFWRVLDEEDKIRMVYREWASKGDRRPQMGPF